MFFISSKSLISSSSIADFWTQEMFTEIKATTALYPAGGAQSSNIPFRSNLSETLKLEISEFNNGKKNASCQNSIIKILST